MSCVCYGYQAQQKDTTGDKENHHKNKLTSRASDAIISLMPSTSLAGQALAGLPINLPS
jgi:hypothetical protein